MWQEEIADYTASHLRSHIGAYLEAIEAEKGDNIKLRVPQGVETENLVGGVYSVDTKKLPAYAVDVMNKHYVGGGGDDAYLYSYEGHIAIIVSAASEAAANVTVKRHARAVERFVREHQFLHVTEVVVGQCSIHEFGFADMALSGAAKIEETSKNIVWVAGARVDVVWVTRETGFGQHAS